MHRSSNLVVAILLLGAATAFILPLGHAEKPEPPTTKLPAGVVRLTPKPFFEGPTERLGRHIDWDTVCYAVECAGDSLPIKLEMVEWRGGKASEPRLWSKDIIKGNGEASLVIRHVEDAREKRTAGERVYLHSSIICDHGRSSGHFIMPTLKGETDGRGRVQAFAIQDKPVELSKGRPIALCALLAGDGLERQPGGETFEQKAMRVEWAAVVLLSVREKENFEK